MTFSFVMIAACLQVGMGKRGAFSGGKRRTVLQLDDGGSRKPPTYGLGYRAASEEPARDHGRTLQTICAMVF